MFVCIPFNLCMCTYIHSYFMHLVAVCTCMSVCLSVSGACAHVGIIHLLCYIYILADTWSHIYLHNVEFVGPTRLSDSRLFGHAGCGEFSIMSILASNKTGSGRSVE